jgi:hypothetical protein
MKGNNGTSRILYHDIFAQTITKPPQCFTLATRHTKKAEIAHRYRDIGTGMHIESQRQGGKTRHTKTQRNTDTEKHEQERHRTHTNAETHAEGERGRPGYTHTQRCTVERHI